MFSLWNLSIYIQNKFLDQTPKFLIMFLFLIPVIYIVNKDVKTISKVSLICFILSIVEFLASVFGLVNYIDFNKLDLLRSKLRILKNKYNQNYNVTYMFNNHHDNGKQCLIAATFSKRFQEDIPVITMVIRASEITKRLIFDFLLIQRMAEYVYGPDQSVQINLFATQMYGNVETLLMYSAYKPLKKVIKGIDNPWTKRVKEVYKKIQKGTEKEWSSFKVFFRSFKVLRPDLYEYQALLAKDLLLEYEDIEYPENVISYSQRKAYKKKLLKKQKNENLQ